MKYLMEYRGDIWIVGMTKEQQDMLHYLASLNILPDDFQYTDIEKIHTENVSDSLK